MWEKEIFQREKMACTKDWRMVRMTVKFEELRKIQNDHSIKNEE